MQASVRTLLGIAFGRTRAGNPSHPAEANENEITVAHLPEEVPPSMSRPGCSVVLTTRAFEDRFDALCQVEAPPFRLFSGFDPATDDCLDPANADAADQCAFNAGARLDPAVADAAARRVFADLYQVDVQGGSLGRRSHPPLDLIQSVFAGDRLVFDDGSLLFELMPYSRSLTELRVYMRTVSAYRRFSNYPYATTPLLSEYFVVTVEQAQHYRSLFFPRVISFVNIDVLFSHILTLFTDGAVIPDFADYFLWLMKDIYSCISTQLSEALQSEDFWILRLKAREIMTHARIADFLQGVKCIMRYYRKQGLSNLFDHQSCCSALERASRYPCCDPPSRLLVRMLLIMGGIEQNPGPVSQTVELAKLVKRSPRFSCLFRHLIDGWFPMPDRSEVEDFFEVIISCGLNCQGGWNYIARDPCFAHFLDHFDDLPDSMLHTLISLVETSCECLPGELITTLSYTRHYDFAQLLSTSFSSSRHARAFSLLMLLNDIEPNPGPPKRSTEPKCQTRMRGSRAPHVRRKESRFTSRELPESKAELHAPSGSRAPCGHHQRYNIKHGLCKDTRPGEGRRLVKKVDELRGLDDVLTGLRRPKTPLPEYPRQLLLHMWLELLCEIVPCHSSHRRSYSLEGQPLDFVLDRVREMARDVDVSMLAAPFGLKTDVLLGYIQLASISDDERARRIAVYLSLMNDVELNPGPPKKLTIVRASEVLREAVQEEQEKAQAIQDAQAETQKHLAELKEVEEKMKKEIDAAKTQAEQAQTQLKAVTEKSERVEQYLRDAQAAGFIAESQAVTRVFAFHGKFKRNMASTFRADSGVDLDGTTFEADPIVTVNVTENLWSSDAMGQIQTVVVEDYMLEVAATGVSCSEPSRRMHNIYNGINQCEAAKKRMKTMTPLEKLRYMQELELVAFLLTGSVSGTGNVRWMNNFPEWVPGQYLLPELTEDEEKRLKGVTFHANSLKFQANQSRKSRAGPFIMEGHVPHMPDASNMTVLKRGMLKRFFPDDLGTRSPRVLQDITRIANSLADKIINNVNALASTPQGRVRVTDELDDHNLLEHMLAGRPKPEADEIREGYCDAAKDPSQAIKEYKDQAYHCFIKLEAYPDGSFKPPRFIMSLKPRYRGYQAFFMLKVLKYIELGTLDCNVKGSTPEEITRRLRDRFEGHSDVAETDYTCFDVSIGIDLKRSCEYVVYERVASALAFGPFIPFLQECLNRSTVTVVGPCFTIPKYHHVRMSGDLWTSIGNLVTNISLTSYSFEVPLDYLFSHAYFEGDDGAIILGERDVQHIMARATECGVKLKLSVGPWQSLSFCGNHFVVIDGVPLRHRDPYKAALNCTVLHGMQNDFKTNMELIRSKNIAYLSGPVLPDCFVLNAVIERYTRSVRVSEDKLLRMGLCKEYTSYGVEKCVPDYLVHDPQGRDLSTRQFVDVVYARNYLAGGLCPRSRIEQMVRICEAHQIGDEWPIRLPCPFSQAPSGAWYFRDGLLHTHTDTRGWAKVPRCAYNDLYTLEPVQCNGLLIHAKSLLGLHLFAPPAYEDNYTSNPLQVHTKDSVSGKKVDMVGPTFAHRTFYTLCCVGLVIAFSWSVVALIRLGFVAHAARLHRWEKWVRKFEYFHSSANEGWDGFFVDDFYRVPHDHPPLGPTFRDVFAVLRSVRWITEFHRIPFILLTRLYEFAPLSPLDVDEFVHRSVLFWMPDWVLEHVEIHTRALSLFSSLFSLPCQTLWWALIVYCLFVFFVVKLLPKIVTVASAATRLAVTAIYYLAGLFCDVARYIIPPLSTLFAYTVVPLVNLVLKVLTFLLPRFICLITWVLNWLVSFVIFEWVVVVCAVASLILIVLMM